MNYPANQMKFEKMFSTEQRCIDYLIKIRWPNGFICPKCKHDDYWIVEKNLMKCKRCKYRLSPTAATIFHRSKKPLMVWFRAMWWMIVQKNGVSALSVQRILGLGSYKTAWTWLHKFRRLMVVPGRDKLSGRVEVDETLVGGKKSGKRGRGAEGKVLVVIAVEVKDRGAGRARLSIIPSASKRSLKKFITQNVESGSCIISDGWKSYNDVELWGYTHEIKNETKTFEKQEVLPNVHRIASLLKRWLLGTHQSYMNTSHLEYYLDEFTFRYNRRKSKSRGLLFYRLIEQAVAHKPVSYDKIINT